MRKQIITGYHIKVIPKTHLYGIRTIVAKTDIQAMANQIKRYVDNIGNIEIIEDYEDVCEYCGHTWTELGDKNNGGCCQQDIDECTAPRPKPIEVAWENHDVPK